MKSKGVGGGAKKGLTDRILNKGRWSNGQGRSFVRVNKIQGGGKNGIP